MPSGIRKSTSVALKFFVALLAIFAFGVRTTNAASCENLASISLANVTITSAESVAAGAFTPPADASAQRCKVRPTAGVLPDNCDACAFLRLRYQD